MGATMKIRIKFRKNGPVRFIGHLDVMRFFQKALRRAEIDVAYSGGFSPHPIMSFASPLGVGLESNGEYVDIEVNSVTDSEDMLNRLNQASAPGIEAVSVKLLPEKAENAMASVAAAAYTVRFREGREPRLDCAKALPMFLEQEHILIRKETKKGEREVDLRPGIYEFSISGEGRFSMLVDASSAGNIKPGLVMAAFLTANGETLQENALQITREDIYTNAGTESAPKLVSLDSVGTCIPRGGK